MRSLVPISRYLHNVTCTEMFAIAEKMIDGETKYRMGHYEAAFKDLREAIRLEDTLNYDEPWGWMIPVRHAYAALKLERGLEHDIKDSYAAYQKDLEMYPDNVWSLVGLKRCLLHDHNHALKFGSAAVRSQLDSVASKLKIALAGSDVEVEYSCFCAGVKKMCCSAE